MTSVGLTGSGSYVPDETLSGEAIAEASGLPEDVVIDKMGMRQKHVCAPEDDHCTDMAIAAAEAALADADIDPESLDLVLYHGSEYKDYVVWSGAANVAERLGATEAFATESYTLCAGAPIAVRKSRAMLVADHVDTALLVTASREEDLIDYENEDSSFMFNFGSGGSAMVLEADPHPERTHAWVHHSAAITDGSFSEDVVMPAGGSRQPPTEETVERGLHTLDVRDPDDMKARLAPVSLPNYLEVADDALERSGYDRSDLAFVALTHMKRSFHERVVEELGLERGADDYYLDEYGHMQSVDQVIAVEEGRQRGRLDGGDVVLFLAAGTGYTWSATALEWLG